MELNNLKTESSKLRLTPQEKAAMKARIFGVASPLAPQPSSYFAYSFQFVHARVLVPAFAVVLIFGGVSTTAAAHGALPGDVLYPVKISINEAIKVAFATTPVARAEVSAELAVRRVEEAEVLAARGELTAQTGEELAANFEAHAEEANEQAREVEEKDPATAESLRTKLGSSLSAHGEILAMLTVGGGEANQEGTGVVAAKVLARADSAPAPVATVAARFTKAAPAPADAAPQATTMAMTLSVATDVATSAQAEAASVSLEADMMIKETSDEEDREQEQAAIQLKTRATEQLAAVRAKFDKNKGELAGSSVTQVSGELREIEQLVELGSTTLATGHHNEAQGDFTAAIRRSIKLYVLLGAQAKLQQNIILPILQKAIEPDTEPERPDADAPSEVR